MIPEETITRDTAKQAVLSVVDGFNEEIDRNWGGTLNEANIFKVADLIRRIFEDRLFAIATVHYADSGNPDVRLKTGSHFNSYWTDGRKDMVRVFTTEGHNNISFSAGGFVWYLRAAPGTGDHENYQYTYLSFTANTMKFSSRAPAGCLHTHVFCMQDGKLRK